MQGDLDSYLSTKTIVAVPAPANDVAEASSEIPTSKKYLEPIAS